MSYLDSLTSQFSKVVETATATSAANESQLLEMKKRVDELEKANQDLSKEAASVKLEKDELEKKHDNLRRDASKKISQLKESNSTLEKTVTALKEKVKEKIHELQQLETKGESVPASPLTSESVEKAKEGDEDSREEVGKLRSEVEAMRSREHELTQRLERQEESFTIERDSFAAALLDVNSLKTTITEQDHAIEDLKAQLQAASSSAEQSNAARLDEVAQVNTLLKEERAKVEDLERRNADLLSNKNEEQQVHEITHPQSHENEDTSKLQALITLERSEHERSLADLQAKISRQEAELSEKITSLSSENAALKQRLASALEKEDQEKNAVKHESDGDVARLTEANAQLEQELENLKKSSRAAEEAQAEELSLLRDHIQRLESERSDLEEKFSLAASSSADPSKMVAPEAVDFKLRVEHMENEKFSMNEQLKDFKIQIMNKQSEITELKNKLAQQEDRVGKLKGMLTKSTTAIQEKKEVVLKLEAKIEQLESEMGAALDDRQRYLSQIHAHQAQIEQYKVEIGEVTRATGTTIEDLTRRLKTSEEQLNDVREEYKQYKSRAHTLFKDKAIDTSQAKIMSLEGQVEALKKEARTQLAALEEARDALRQTEEDLHKVQVRLVEVEEKTPVAEEKSKRVESLEGEVAQLESELEQLKRTHQQSGRDFERKSKLEKQVAEEEKEALRMDNETLRKAKEQENYDLLFQNQRLQAQVSSLEDDLRRAVRQGEAGGGDSQMGSRKPSENGFDQNGGSPRSLQQQHSQTKALTEKQYADQIQHLSNMLSESEEAIERLLSQEAVLKAEIRRLDGLEGLQNAQLPYMKNIVLRFLESADKEPLIPVLATVLHFTPEEVFQLRQKVSQSSSVIGRLGFFG